MGFCFCKAIKIKFFEGEHICVVVLVLVELKLQGLLRKYIIVFNVKVGD